VAVLFAEVLDVVAGGLEDLQAEEPEHVTSAKSHRFGRVLGGSKQRLELQVGQSWAGFDSLVPKGEDCYERDTRGMVRGMK
jgi:hypothetical protein